MKFIQVMEFESSIEEAQKALEEYIEVEIGRAHV